MHRHCRLLTLSILLSSDYLKLEWGGERSLLPFSKNWKKVPQFWGKNTLITVIYELNFSFKVQCSRVSRRKKPEIFSCDAFLFRVIDYCLSKRPNS